MPFSIATWKFKKKSRKIVITISTLTNSKNFENLLLNKGMEIPIVNLYPDLINNTEIKIRGILLCYNNFIYKAKSYDIITCKQAFVPLLLITDAFKKLLSTFSRNNFSLR